MIAGPEPGVTAGPGSDLTAGPAAARPVQKPRRRAALAPLAAILGAAVALAGGLLRWLDQSYGTDRSGLLTRTGFQATPALLPLALVALAGLAASYAARGVLRKVIGAAVGAVGAGLAAAALSNLTNPPRVLTTDAGLPAPADLMGPVSVHPVGPILVLAGAVMLCLAGVLVMTAQPAGRALGTRYERGAAATAISGRTSVSAPAARAVPAVPGASDDPDTMAALWKAMDGGADPTMSAPLNPREGERVAPPAADPGRS